MIRVEHLSRRFGTLAALDDVSFEVGRGEVVGFLGPNGAGKTTAMRILAGYLPASSGSASVAGFDVLAQSMEVRARIGYLPENVPLYREHRVEEMLRFHARLHRVPRGRREARIGEALSQVGLQDRRRDLIGGLSRGLRQRVALALALLHEPEVLILDEPTSGLDPLQRMEVRNLLRELGRDRTVLLSSHILPEIEAACPRVIVIHRGKIVADGSPDELVSKLGGAASVRLEAAVGADVEKAVRLLSAIRGVRDVADRGRLGVHHVFDVHCDEDLREDVGALAAQQRWVPRELSWRRPTLEQIFARLTIGLDPWSPDEPLPSVAPLAAAPPPAELLVAFPGAPGTRSTPGTPIAPGNAPGNAPGRGPSTAPSPYNLNPFRTSGAPSAGPESGPERAP